MQDRSFVVVTEWEDRIEKVAVDGTHILIEDGVLKVVDGFSLVQAFNSTSWNRVYEV